MSHRATNLRTDSAPLPLELHECATLIGTDPVNEEHVAQLCAAMSTGRELDPVIIYVFRNARFIAEGNHRAYACSILGRPVPCIIVQNNADFERLRRMPIHLGKVATFESLQQLHDALASHFWARRRDIYWKYFADENIST
ncbi:MAG: ParB N-terminal domain-containing protein [Planctomycetes bacterium]|nr:ParB N-terminal domain-containing protein [Planctomycetota bacterium]